MPARRTAEHWVERIRALKATEDLGPKAIRGRLFEEDPEGRLGSPSSEKTIARILKDFGAASEEEKVQYRLFAWPQSMIEEVLPWESSRPLLGLLRYLQTIGAKRPSTRLAKWYWRVHLTAPDAPPSALQHSQSARGLGG